MSQQDAPEFAYCLKTECNGDCQECESYHNWVEETRQEEPVTRRDSNWPSPQEERMRVWGMG